MTEESTEFSYYVSSLRRRRPLILGIWVPAVILTALLAVGLPSKFVSTATFQLKPQLTNNNYGNGNDKDQNNQGDTYADRYVSGLADAVLGSADLRAALSALVPYPQLKDDPVEAQKELQGDVDVAMITQKILDPVTGLERKVNTGFTVSYANRDPQTAQRVAAWLANAFTLDSRRAAAAPVQRDSQFYAAEADRQREKIGASETQLAKFKQENFDRLPDTTQENVSLENLTDEDLRGVERDLHTQQENRTFILQQLQQARAAGANEDTLQDLEAEYQKKLAVYDPNYPDMIQLRQQIDAMRHGYLPAGPGSSLEDQLAEQRTMLTQLRQRYSEDYPDVQRVERTIKDLQARIASGEKDKNDTDNGIGEVQTPAVVQLKTQLKGVEGQIAALEQQREFLRTKDAKLRGNLQSTPEVERAYDTLTRDADTAKKAYDDLISERIDADVRAAGIMSGTADQFKLVDAPVVAKKATKPPRIGVAIIGLIGATLLAFMAALGASALDSSVRGRHDLLALLNVAPIGIVPLIRNAEFARRRRRRMAALVATAVIAVPALYLLIHFAAP
jgi:polysaccharide biosynthesis transport protein